MRIISWGLKFLIPFVVLFTIGYYIPGFSALTIPWLVVLSILIILGDRIIYLFGGRDINRLGRGIGTFLIATVVIVIATLAIQGGNVPLVAAMLAAIIIAFLNNMVPFNRFSIGEKK